MRIRPGALLDGAGWAVGLAAALIVFSLIALIAELQSPDAVLWTGQRVVGTEQHGLAYFRWHGRTYATPMQGYGSARAVTIYLDPANPDNAMADNLPTRMVTGLLAGGPLVAAAAVLTIGLTRKRRWARRQQRRPAPGGGDPDLYARLLQQRRGGEPGSR
jgi:hypothetical protein